MKKKIFSAALLVALMFLSTNVFVSCKDYDDDINNLQGQVDGLSAALENTKTEINGTIATLQSQLETKDAELAALIEGNTTNIEANKAEIAKVAAEVAVLESRLETAEMALDDVEALAADLSANKADKTELTAAVTKLETSLATVQSGLEEKIAAVNNGVSQEVKDRKAAVVDLQQQIDALKNFETLVSGYNIPKVKENVKTLLADVATIKGQIGEFSYEQLKNELQALSGRIDANLAQINALNVLVKTSLRSLVFEPQAYYWGIEAAKITSMYYNVYEIGTAHADIEETGAHINHPRMEVEGSKVLDFFANYHLNPSSADLSDVTEADVKILFDDKEFIHDRASAAALAVKSIDKTFKPGMLKVNLDAKQGMIQEVAKNGKVTVFAAQVTVNKGDQDTTITSDYATIYKDTIEGLRLTHRKAADVPYTGVANTDSTNFINGVTCGPCPLTGNLGHLFAARQEAVTAEPQDTCNWNETLDLRKLVEVHYSNTNKTHGVLSAELLKAYGLKIKFELTGLKFGSNKTSESAQAAIAADGYTFRPQLPKYKDDAHQDGIQDAYGATQARSTIGRTPLVRVSLIDTTANNAVYDYGYIRIKITEKVVDPEAQPDLYVPYVGGPWAYNGECFPLDWSFKMSWAQAQLDVLNKLNVSRTEFEAHYEIDSTGNVLNQYYKDGDNFKAVDLANPAIGQFIETREIAGGTHTDVVIWNIPEDWATNDMYYWFVLQRKSEIARAVKYVSDDVTKSQYPDVYIMVTVGHPNITIAYPSAEVKWDKIAEYWYVRNSNTNGAAEIHANVITPEDDATGNRGNELTDLFSDVFVQNDLSVDKLITNLVDNTKNYDGSPAQDYTNSVNPYSYYNFQFHKSNVGRLAVGVDSVTMDTIHYYLDVASKAMGDSTLLTATRYINGVPSTETIARLMWKNNSGNIHDCYVDYLHTDFGHSILNYKEIEPAYEADENTSNYGGLGDNVLTATVALRVLNHCQMQLPLKDNTFDVRFLRPLNVWENDTVIEDASVEELQTIKLVNRLKFKDWRAAWKGTQLNQNYFVYYGIRRIYVSGVNDGEGISMNPNVLCSLNGSNMVPLTTITDQLDFIYNETDCTLEYRNNSSTLQAFKVQVPVTVEYYWGKVTRNVTIDVKSTHANNTSAEKVF